MVDIPRVDVLGVGISAVNMQMAVAAVREWVEQGARQYVCVTGVHGVMESQDDPLLLRIHNESGLTTPDGMPMVWAGKRAGAGWIERVYGPDLMLAVLEQAAARGWTSYLYGGAPHVPDLLATRLRETISGLKIVGRYSPPFRSLTEEEMDEAADRINATKAALVWVGLSTPKQEHWMYAMRPRLQAPVLLGVGAAFDFHAGLLKQAPVWMQRSGLEWSYRLAREPRRLWRRYARNNPRYLMSIIRRPPQLIEAVSA